ncbi:hypothetical protein AMAG_12780 [Allomyces macrogynus ATCC 38327]|uniref:Aip3p/Bud6 N-terminal domain-containing protein n=1 Tax=Allomyces macrogynus (strain ATCC 38327) TaxID=578462 RepID=A0A0L0T210_ALLM3|nr:hypothetical protein AMAG_12780 [Allomyces macrogynus ATCC 38327]|eukprot:KNE68609.1 hypothetical protein AMAG_12780 [Allomyces macrogynus ATCC 38327]
MTTAPTSPAPAEAAPPPSPDDARVFLSQSLQRLTASCRALLHALAEYADDPTIEEQQLSLLYTAVVKAYFYTLQDFEQYKIDVDSLRDFPLHMRDALDAVFDDMAAPAAAKAEMLDATADEINALMTRLIRTLKDRARAYLTGTTGGTTGMSPPGTPLSSTSSSADYFGPRKVRKPSVLSTLSTITTTLAPPPPVLVKAPPPKPAPVKLYLQYDTEVKQSTTAEYASCSSAISTSFPTDTFPKNRTRSDSATFANVWITFLTSGWSGATPYRTSPYGAGRRSRRSICTDGCDLSSLCAV